MDIIAYDLKVGFPKMGGGKKKNKLRAWGGERGAWKTGQNEVGKREKDLKICRFENLKMSIKPTYVPM